MVLSKVFRDGGGFWDVEMSGLVWSHVSEMFTSVRVVPRNPSSFVIKSLKRAFAVPFFGGVVRKLVPKPSTGKMILVGNLSN